MARTRIRQESQILSSDTYADTVGVGPSLQSQTSVEGDLNALRTQVRRALYGDTLGHWYDDLEVPLSPEPGVKRGLQDLNTGLHALERKRVLVRADAPSSVLVPAGQNFIVLVAGKLPANPVVAVDTTPTLGSVAASGVMGAASLNAVAGDYAVSPKNLCEIRDAVTRGPLLSGGRLVYALLQTDASDAASLVGGDAQLSFVRVDSSGSALESVPVIDIAGRLVVFSAVERKALTALAEQDLRFESFPALTPDTHETLRSLAHEIVETSYDEITRDNASKVSSIITWSSPAKVQKVREVLLTRDTQRRVAVIQTRQYDIYGTHTSTLTETLVRGPSGKVVDISRVRT